MRKGAPEGVLRPFAKFSAKSEKKMKKVLDTGGGRWYISEAVRKKRGLFELARAKKDLTEDRRAWYIKNPRLRECTL